jgi:serine/threonine-protein kinase
VIDVGQVLDKYELLERVGQGGMAIVYRGLDRSLQREVAVKVLHRHLSEHQEARDRFEREAHAVAKLRHENILEIFDYKGSDESYIVTEFIEGQTLKQFVTDHPPQFPEIGAMIVTQICRALAHAHAQGILHRDVKPENVMIRTDGVVKLMDFGISQMIDTQRLTVTGQLLGSPAYMSPEHVEGGRLDYRTDVFAAGIVLYQLTVGKLPFEGKNPHEILKRIAECKFTDPRHITPRIGNELGRIILRAMARDPDARYRDMGEMLTALERYLDGSGLNSVKEELARFFKAPAPYEMALKARLVDHLLRRAKDSLRSNNQAVALELLDRILAIDPVNAQVTEILGKLGKRRRVRTWALAAAGVVLAGGGAWAVRHEIGGSRGGAAAVPDGGMIAVIEADAQRDVDVVVPIDGGVIDAPKAIIDAREKDLADAKGIRSGTGSGTGRRIDAGVPDAGSGATVKLTVSPPGSEISVGDGAWTKLETGNGEVEVPAGGVVVHVRNEACCESTDRRLSTDDTSVSINLGLLPGRIIPTCKVKGVDVRVDGRKVRLGDAALIPFGRDTTQTSKTVAVEFTGETIDLQEVKVRYNEQVEVACKLE